MSISISSEIACFFVFNPKLGEEDTEGEKLLLFHPQLDINTQKNYVGLCEGMIGFSEDFSKNYPVRVIQTRKFKIALLNPEENYWVVMMVHKSALNYLPEDDLTYDVYIQKILNNFYDLFVLHNGTFDFVLSKERRCGLRHRLGLFSSFFLPTISPHPNITLPTLNTLSEVNLDRTAFLTIQYLISSLTSHFPSVEVLEMVYNGKLVHSNLDSDGLVPLHLSTTPQYLHYMQLNSVLQVPDMPDLPYKVKRAKCEWYDLNRFTCPVLKHYGDSRMFPIGYATGPLKKHNPSSVLPRVWVRCSSDELMYRLNDDNIDLSSHWPSKSIYGAYDKRPSVHFREGGLIVYHNKGVIISMLLSGPKDDRVCEPKVLDVYGCATEEEAYSISGSGSVLPRSGISLGPSEIKVLTQLDLFLNTNIIKISDILQISLNSADLNANVNAGLSNSNTPLDKLLGAVDYLWIDDRRRVLNGTIAVLSEDLRSCINLVHAELTNAKFQSMKENSVLERGLRSKANEYFNTMNSLIAYRRERCRQDKEMAEKLRLAEEQAAFEERQRVKEEKRRLREEARERELELKRQEWASGREERDKERQHLLIEKTEERDQLQTRLDNGEDVEDDLMLLGDIIDDLEYALENDPMVMEEEEIVDYEDEDVGEGGDRDMGRYLDDEDDEGDYHFNDFDLEWADIFGRGRSTALDVTVKCDKTWVIGRRGVHSKRTFFFLVDDKNYSTVGEAQLTIDTVSRHLFQNMFIH